MGASRKQVFHASSVAFGNQAILILGPSGSGKSALALDLITLGATLIADDQTCVHVCGGALRLQRPAELPPWIEARGVGLLRAPLSDENVPLALVIDMGELEKTRLPKSKTWTFAGQSVPLLSKVDAPYFPSAIRLYVLHGPAPYDS